MADQDSARGIAPAPEQRSRQSRRDEPQAGAADHTIANPAQSPRGAADLLPSVSLPKSGGAISGLGEKFSVAAATGTASMSVPLPLSPGRAGFTPGLQLSYDSGAGNGPFGFGWQLGTPAIIRKTDKGLPLYRDGDESDVFVLAGAEDLVPIPGDARLPKTRTVYRTEYRIFYYRPRVEGAFVRIERWVAGATGVTHWRSLSRDNVTTLYGYDPTSRICDPTDPTRIFSWQISRSWDAHGNAAVYVYANEDGAGIDGARAHEANRSLGGRRRPI